ncbi:hypothetical protein BJ878DRAFT_520789 [Calycina marina]|uniref:Uncharacterized protein n=1 Tax=Calycina marina TaxID=1763456 RepID=A0A9P7YXF1_9HELO|nr:hypothetical protein BJ878DRAFT_520789 [Calycina marina]
MNNGPRPVAELEALIRELDVIGQDMRILKINYNRVASPGSDLRSAITRDFTDPFEDRFLGIHRAEGALRIALSAHLDELERTQRDYTYSRGARKLYWHVRWVLTGRRRTKQELQAITRSRADLQAGVMSFIAHCLPLSPAPGHVPQAPQSPRGQHHRGDRVPRPLGLPPQPPAVARDADTLSGTYTAFSRHEQPPVMSHPTNLRKYQ